MNKEREFLITVKSKNYKLVTDEYIGSKELKYSIRAELRGEKCVSLFIMGIPDVSLLYANSINAPEEKKIEKLYQIIINSIKEFASSNDFVEGKTYYGEYLPNGSFVIDLNKPAWEDGNWGQKI